MRHFESLIPESSRPVRVFLSYAWETVAYRRQVKALATRLRLDGVDVRLDAWHLAGKTIPEFMNAEVRHADRLLIVCSPEYQRKVHAMEDGQTSGVGWECMLLTANMYRNDFRETVTAALLQGSWDESAPLFMQGLPFIDLSNYRTFEDNYRSLLRQLTGTLEMAPTLGGLPRDLDPEPVAPMTETSLRIDAQSKERYSDPEQIPQLLSVSLASLLEGKPLGDLHARVKQLTDEQYVVVDFLRYQRRVRVSGCAGSGKTLVAAEKALRLAMGGLSVLFLCHNPRLADHIRLNLIRGRSVQVTDFCTWVREAAGTTSSSEQSWTHYDEPDDETLDRACSNLQKYEAIIVDEAQDFRGKWWTIVESALGSNAFFYIFDDDQQTLVPTATTYPRTDTRLDLSKNCRNAQRVFDLMRCLTRSLPEARLPGGKVRLEIYEPGHETAVVSAVIRELNSQQLTKKTVVLWAGTEPVDDSPLAGCEVMLKAQGSWQEEIARKLDQVLTAYDPRGVKMPTRQALSRGLRELSSEPYPNAADIRRVQDIAYLFGISADVKRRIKTSKFRDRFDWINKPDEFGFAATNAKQNPVWSAEVILKLQSEDWHIGIPMPKSIRIAPYWLTSSESDIPLYGVADFKGMEADVVVMIARGRTHAFKESLYVGVSRARAVLYLLIDHNTKRDLPTSFIWD